MGRAIFKANVVGADRMAREFATAARRIEPAVRRDFQGELAADLEGHFRDYAPYDYDERDSEHIQDTIEARAAGGGGIRVTVTAGTSYMDITRFGTGGPIFPRVKKKLSWIQGGQRIVAPMSAGYTPAGDWVSEAAATVDPEIDEAEDRIGRVIERIVG